MHNDTISRGLTFLAGAATGLALGLYLGSEKGSALRERFGGHLEDLLQGLSERAQEQIGDLMNTLGTAVENGLASLQEMGGEPEESAPPPPDDDVIDTFEEVETAFDAGMDRARERLWKKFAAAGIEPRL